MDIKGLINKGLDKAEDFASKNITEEKIINLIEKISNKLKITLTEENINKIAKKVESVVKDIEIDKLPDFIEKEIKKYTK